MQITQIKEQTDKILNLFWIQSNPELYNEFHKSIKLALDYVLIFPIYIPNPDVSYTDDGEILLNWEINGVKVVFSFIDGEEIGYAYTTKDGNYIPGLYNLNLKQPFDFYSFFN